MKKLLRNLLVLTLLTSSLAQADCLPLYRQKIDSIDARMSGYKTTLITTGVTEAALVGSLVLATGAVAVGSVVAMPAAMVGAGSYLGYLAIEKNQYQKAYTLIRQAQRGQGKSLDKVLAKINKALDTNMDATEFAQLIVEGNEMDAFCERNLDSDKVQLLTFHHLLKHLKLDLE